MQEGEQLVGSGPVAAGDTVRWIIGDTESGTGPTKRIISWLNPARPDLVSNLVINTDRRTYLLELRSAEKAYMASVSWQYPQDRLIALRRQNAGAEAATPIVEGVDISRLRFGVGSELGAGSDSGTGYNGGLIQALRLGANDSLNQTGQKVVQRNLNIQPTLTIRPGFPVRVIVNRDLILEPYKG